MRSKQTSKNNFVLFHDCLIICISILLAILLVQTRALSFILSASSHFSYLGSFIAGILFTSVFTVAPATVSLGEVARVTSPLYVAFFGALGGVAGNLVIFKFMRDKFSEHILEMVGKKSYLQFAHILRHRSFRWLNFLLAGLIIASPLPDEIGVSLLGISHLSTRRFFFISFALNFLGILLIGLVARQL